MTPRPAGGHLAPPLVAAAVRALGATWRVRIHHRDLLDRALRDGAVVAFWHGQLLPMVALHRDRGLVGLTSLSPDGELVAQVIARLGYSVCRGSSSRGGTAALRGALATLRRGGSPALAVDGPRGPRREPHIGAAALSALSGRPVLFGVIAATPALRLRTWDRFELPTAFARVDVAYGWLTPPPDDRQAIESTRIALRVGMERLEADLRAGRLRSDEPPTGR